MTAAVLVLLSAGLSWWLTGRLRDYALKHDVMDVPNARSSHQQPTPRGGGLAIVVSFSLALLVLFFLAVIPGHLLLALLLGGGMIAGIGYRDDHRSVSAGVRMIIHATAVLLALVLLNVWDLVYPWNPWLPGWMNVPLWTVAIVWLLNLYNFMDGIDGIAGVEAVFVAASIALFVFLSQPSGIFLLPLLLATSVLGFLAWNWPPATIFMGDVGSAYLGFVLGVLMVVSPDVLSIPVWSWVVLLGVFLVDATYTLLRRVSTGQQWYSAHCSHAYQIASRRWRSHQAVTVLVLVINILWLCPLAFVLMTQEQYRILLIFLAFLPLLVGVYVLKAGERSDTST